MRETSKSPLNFDVSGFKIQEVLHEELIQYEYQYHKV